MDQDLALANQARGSLRGLLGSLGSQPDYSNQIARARLGMDQATTEAFDRRQGQRREKAAKLGLGSSSFDSLADARLQREEGRQLGENSVNAEQYGRSLGSQDLQGLLSRIGALQTQARTGSEIGQQQYAADNQGGGFSGAFGGLLKQGLSGYLGGKALGMNPWDSAGLGISGNAGLIPWLGKKKVGGGSTMTPGIMAGRFGGLRG